MNPTTGSGIVAIANNMSVNLSTNERHLAFGILASLFLPFGYFAMSLLALPKSPKLGTVSALLSLPSWTPFSALIALDALALDAAQLGGGAQFALLWDKFNLDGVMRTYSGIYGLFHLFTTVILAIALLRAQVIPTWAGIALILSSPLTAIGLSHSELLLSLHLPSVLLTIGSIPAAIKMLKSFGGITSA